MQVQLALAASKLENKDTWGKSDPFVRISKARENGEWMPVLKTEVGGLPAPLSEATAATFVPLVLGSSIQSRPLYVASLAADGSHTVPCCAAASLQVVDNNLTP